ncbi:hypothetical protein QCI77_17130 [Bacillus cereus group sp. MG9]|jgi:hypothetical protein|nr:hypothetical protein [Bacillus mycoides]
MYQKSEQNRYFAQQDSQRNEITACKKRSPIGNITGLHQVELCRIHKGF